MKGYIKITAEEVDAEHSTLSCEIDLAEVKTIDKGRILRTLTNALKMEPEEVIAHMVLIQHGYFDKETFRPAAEGGEIGEENHA